MRKIVTLLIFIFTLGTLLIGCSSSDEDIKSEKNQKDNVTTKNNNNGDNEKKIYQIGETAETHSDVYSFPYAVTVNDFKITTDDVEGMAMEDKGDTTENTRFAVVDITITNTGEEPFVPKDTISAQIVADGMASENDYDQDFFVERNEELKPGEEISGSLVYLGENFLKQDKLYFTYELNAINNEIQFELPVEDKK